MRNINTISHAAMVNAYMKKSVQIEAEHVQSVIERHDVGSYCEIFFPKYFIFKLI